MGIWYAGAPPTDGLPRPLLRPAGPCGPAGAPPMDGLPRPLLRPGRPLRVVIGYGLTPVKILFRLWLQKFVPGVIPQPLVRVLTTV